MPAIRRIHSGFRAPDRLQAALLVVPVMVVLGVISQVGRFRRGTVVERQQLKWVLATMGLVGGLIVVTGVLSELGGLQLPDVVYNVAFLAVPISTGIAILRYRLYEIDVIIRKTLVYTALIGPLALAYLGGIYLIGRVLQVVTGQSGALAVTVSTLTVAAAFQPLRSRIQRRLITASTAVSTTPTQRSEVLQPAAGPDRTRRPSAPRCWPWSPRHCNPDTPRLWLRAVEPGPPGVQAAPPAGCSTLPRGFAPRRTGIT